MPLSMYALDNFVAQDLSQLTECRPAPIAPEFPDYSSWLSLFALNWILTIPLPKEKAVLAFALIRRAEGAIEDYEGARDPPHKFGQWRPQHFAVFPVSQKIRVHSGNGGAVPRIYPESDRAGQELHEW